MIRKKAALRGLAWLFLGCMTPGVVGAATTGRCKLHNLLNHDCEKSGKVAGAGVPAAASAEGGAGAAGTVGTPGETSGTPLPPLSSTGSNVDPFSLEGLSAGTGGVEGGASSLPNIIGDMSPMGMHNLLHIARSGTGFPPLPGGLPSGPPTGTPPRSEPSIFAPSVRGIKIAENQSPLPQDRVFASFNYYQNISADYIQRDQTQYTNLRVYHQTYGAEKTFLGGDASFGVRIPINTLTFTSTVPGAGGTHTGSGDMSFYTKYLLKEVTWSDNRAFYLTTGLSVTPPTGTHSFAGYPTFQGVSRFQNFRSTYTQPFIGYVFVQGKFFFQGISAIDVPVGSGSRDVTDIFNDFSVGYFLYRNRAKGAFLTAIVPSFETHINTPLNHRGYNRLDPASTPDVVNLTLGLNLEFRRNTLLTFGCATPVTGPQPFDYELIGLLNIRYGGRRAAGSGAAIGNVPQAAR